MIQGPFVGQQWEPSSPIVAQQWVPTVGIVGSHCCPTIDLNHADRRTDRQARPAHKVFFAHARA
jgi:hypothetical protein